MSAEIEKMTYSDRRELLGKLFREGWVTDIEDSYVYVEVWTPSNVYKTFRYSYVMDGVVPKVDASTKTEVVRTTQYEVATLEEPITKSFFLNTLNKLLSIGSNNLTPKIKQFDDEEMIAIEPLYCSVGEVDGHGDYIPTIEEMRGMVDAINKANTSEVLQSSISHVHKTAAFKLNRAWVNECECTIGDTVVPKGMPIAEIQFTNKAAWKLRKSGVLLGLSIGAKAQVTEVEDE